MKNKKILTIIIFVLTLFLNINLSNAVDLEPETKEWFLYNDNLFKGYSFPSSNPTAYNSSNKGYFYSEKLEGYVFFRGDTPSWKFDSSTGKYELVGNTIYLTPRGAFSSTKDSGVWYLSASPKDYKTFITRSGIFNGSEIIKDSSGIGGNFGGSPSSDNNEGTGGTGNNNIISNILDSIRRGFDTLLSGITDIIKKTLELLLKGIKDIFKWFLEQLKNLLKLLFIPKDNFIDTHFNELKLKLTNRFGLSEIEGLLNQFKNARLIGFTDVYYKDIKIIDMSYINTMLPRIKNYTDGIFWFMLITYQIDSLYFLIRGTKLFNQSIVNIMHGNNQPLLTAPKGKR